LQHPRSDARLCVATRSPRLTRSLLTGPETSREHTRNLAAGHLACGCANFTDFMDATRISGAAGTLEMCGYI
jgi:hypothetical protein